MAMSKSQKEALDRHITGNYGEDQFREIGDPQVLYTVDVRTRVGIVTTDEDGEHPPLRAAMMMVADHFANSCTNEHNSFDFVLTPQSHPDRPIQIHIED